MSTGVKLGIALGVAAAWGVVWWAFDSAPAGSRRQRLDQRVRLHGQRQIARGWRRPSFIGLTVSVVLTVIVLVWIAGR